MKPEQHPVSVALLVWYAQNARELPWRGEADPYRVWISEVMLQQTRVATVIPYYHAFVGRFGSVAELAAAPLDDVLALWAGLGYYRRARTLHAAAQSLGPDYAVPTTMAGLLAVPGIGRYTAGAIASMAYGIDAPVVDGNVMRVLCRVFGLDGDPYRAPLNRTLWRLAEELIPAGRAADLNQSVMELGALECTPRGPDCGQCPVASMCQARAAGLEEELPRRRVRGARKVLRLAVAIVARGDRVLVRRRPSAGLFGGMWEFPSSELRIGAPWGQAGLAAQLGVDGPWRALPNVVRQLTHRELILSPASVAVAVDTQRREDHRWIAAAEIDEIGMPAAFRAVAREVWSC